MREAVERSVKEHCEVGEYDAALAAALRGYGPEIYGFLVALHRDESEAADVFSRFSEDLWKGLSGFSWECTLRTWAYVLARNASHRQRRGEQARGREVPLEAAIQRLAADVRTATRSWLRTDNKNRFAELRASLPPEDQTLLILRVDRGLAWEELARVTLGDDPAPSQEACKRESARLRKRFQLVRERLQEMGRRAGLIGGDQAK